MSHTRPASCVFTAPDAEQTVQALRALHSALLVSLEQHLPQALHGSAEATRCYVADYRRLTHALMEQARTLRPDRILPTTRGPTFCDSAGRPADALVGALENTSAEAPFSTWAGSLSISEAVGLHLANRFRGLLGCQVLSEPPDPPPVDDDLAAQRFLRRVRFHLNHPETMNPLRRIMEAFGLSKTDTAKLFGVTRQAISQWLTNGVPSERQEKLTSRSPWSTSWSAGSRPSDSLASRAAPPTPMEASRCSR